MDAPRDSAAATGLSIEPAAVALALERGEPLQVLDVRAAHRLASGSIDVPAGARFVNMAGSQVMALDDAADAGLDPALPVVTVCGHGNSSLTVARHLAERGWDVHSLAGGMNAWMQVLLPRELAAPEGFDHLVQFDRIGKGALGYLLVSGDQALAIDVPRNSGPYAQRAAERGARIVAVAETHVHADYISGGPQLAQRTGAAYYVHPADMVYPYDGTPGRLDHSPLAEGQELRIGRGSLRVVHTPGHTEGSVTYMAADAAFTGDFLFIASVGRPDLADRTAEWTEALFDSLTRARGWPGELRIFPAHYGGDAERSADRSVGRTLDEVRAGNASLCIAERADFREWVHSRIAGAPEAYRRIKGVNVGIFDADDAEASELEAGRNECALQG